MKRLLICLMACLSILPVLAASGTITVNGVVYGYKYEKEIHLVSGGTSTIHFSGSANVENGDAAEGAVEILSYITIPDPEGDATLKVTSISSYAFNGNTKITNVIIPDGTVLGSYNVFSGCTNLKSVNLPGGTSIGYRCFMGCENLETVTLREAIKTIDEGAFRSCTSLTSIDLSKGVTSISKMAFYKCSSLKRVTFPESGLTKIGESCFDSCSSLEYINIPASATNIGNYVCSSCTSLKEAIIQNGKQTLDGMRGLFQACTNLTKATITWDGELPNHMFDGCNKLKTVNLSKVTTIGWESFFGCTSLESINIPNTVKKIQGSAFEQCENLKNVLIPNSVTEIANSAFEGCTSLSSVTIPNSVTSIGSAAFKDCTSLTCVIVDIATPLSIKESTFTNRANATLYVPMGCVDAYRAANYWKDFKNIVEIGEGDVNGDGKVDFDDATCIMNYLVGKELQYFIMKAADMNKNGQIDIGDAVTIVNLLKGKISTTSR